MVKIKKRNLYCSGFYKVLSFCVKNGTTGEYNKKVVCVHMYKVW